MRLELTGGECLVRGAGNLLDWVHSRSFADSSIRQRIYPISNQFD